MISKSPDYRYALDLVDRINSVKIEGKRVSESFVFNGVNYWYFYQASIFGEAKNFSKEKKITQVKFIGVKGFIVSLVLLFYSIGSLLLLFFSRRKVLVFSGDNLSTPFWVISE